MRERRTKELQFFPFSQSTIAVHTVIAANPAHFFRVHRLFLVPAAAMTIQFHRTASILSGPMLLAPGAPFILPYSEEPWFTGALNQAFQIEILTAVQMGGSIEAVLSS